MLQPEAPFARVMFGFEIKGKVFSENNKCLRTNDYRISTKAGNIHFHLKRNRAVYTGRLCHRLTWTILYRSAVSDLHKGHPRPRGLPVAVLGDEDTFFWLVPFLRRLREADAPHREVCQQIGSRNYLARIILKRLFRLRDVPHKPSDILPPKGQSARIGPIRSAH